MFFKRKKIAAHNAKVVEAIFKRDSDLRSQGFIPWRAIPPRGYFVVEAIRQTNDNVEIIHPHLLRPEFNVGNLWWRPLNNIIDANPRGYIQ